MKTINRNRINNAEQNSINKVKYRSEQCLEGY